MHREPAVGAHPHSAADLARSLDAFVRPLDDVPGARPDELREIVLVPCHLRRRDVPAVVGENARLAPVQLCEPNEVLLPDPRRTRRHRAPVELPHAGGHRRSVCERPIERIARAPRIRAQEQSPLLGEATAEAARRKHDRRLGDGCERRLQPHVRARGEQRGERARIESLARRARVLRVLPHRLGAERDEPRERVVETLPYEPLERFVAARALGPEVLPPEVTPHDAAREQHRAADARPLLDHHRLEPQLARAHGGDEPGHAGSHDEH